MIIRDAVERAAKRLRTAGIDQARQDAWLLLGHVQQRERATLLANSRDILDADDQRSFEKLVDRRARREPLAQIVGRKEFWSLDFRVTTDVLCPRPDSECLIEAALANVEKRCPADQGPNRILDLGTGSGCLLLALLSEWPTARGVGVDVNTRALSLARSNGERLGLAARTHWLCSNWGASLDGSFDLIVSNPPYIATSEALALAPEIKQFEPAEALFAGQDGLDAYRSLGADLRRLLAPDGFACLEIGIGQANSVEVLVKSAGLKTTGRRQDLAGIDRCLIVEHF